MIPTCEREHEVVGLALSRRWPDCADADLRRHVDECEACRDALSVTELLASDRDALSRDLHLPAAGQVWWRAALRAHTEAAAAARRPLIWLQGIAGACGVAIVAALISATWPWMSEAVAAFGSMTPDVAPLIDAVRPMMPVALGVLACVLLAPIVVYLALSDK